MSSHQPTSEEQIKTVFLKALEGCDTSYNSFLKQIAKLLRGYFRKRLQAHPTEVEDLIQEVLIAVHNQRHTYERQYPVTAWAHGIARYKLLDFYREKKAAVTVDIDDVQDFLLVEEQDGLDARHDVVALLEQLPEKQRAAIAMVKLEGLSIKEAALRLAQTESGVKVNVHRGLKQLGNLLKMNRS